MGYKTWYAKTMKSWDSMVKLGAPDCFRTCRETPRLHGWANSVRGTTSERVFFFGPRVGETVLLWAFWWQELCANDGTPIWPSFPVANQIPNLSALWCSCYDVCKQLNSGTSAKNSPSVLQKLHNFIYLHMKCAILQQLSGITHILQEKRGKFWPNKKTWWFWEPPWERPPHWPTTPEPS